MGFYSRVVFPRLLHWGFSNRVIENQRRHLVSMTHREVLEVGAGCGLSLPYYPGAVESFTGLDANPGMIRLALRQSRPLLFPVRWCLGDLLRLPFGGETFDVVVSSWTLCGVTDVEAALGEIGRVLRSGGRFLFVEHGLSPDSRVRRWQKGLTPLQKKVADGCHLDRPIGQSIRAQPWHRFDLEEFYLEKCPRSLGYTYRGVAVKA